MRVRPLKRQRPESSGFAECDFASLRVVSKDRSVFIFREEASGFLNSLTVEHNGSGTSETSGSTRETPSIP